MTPPGSPAPKQICGAQPLQVAGAFLARAFGCAQLGDAAVERRAQRAPHGFEAAPHGLGQGAGRLRRRQGGAQPVAKARHRRERAETLDARKLGGQQSRHLLDQEGPQRDSAQSRLAVADAVERRQLKISLRFRLAVDGDQRRNRGRHFRQQRNLDEDQRLVRQRGVEEREAAAVILQAAAQIVPAADFVYGFVADELLEQRGRRVPVDAGDAQEAGVEPRLQQVMEVVVDLLKFTVLWQRIEQPLAHADDDAGAARGAIQPPQQFLPRRLDCLGERGQMRAVGGLGVLRGRDQHRARFGRELGLQRLEESELVFLRQRGIQGQRVLRQRDTGRLAAFRQQLPAGLHKLARLQAVALQAQRLVAHAPYRAENRDHHRSLPCRVSPPEVTTVGGASF
ncbi:MAG: hypothetical protein IPI73_13645 [Betaproteobacteria bacterium]|nr:hypothetical protein [Betaproteobacteria bacterium]